MNRKLALFFDGTWGTPEDKTNVSQLFDRTRSWHQFRCQYNLLGKKSLVDKAGEDRASAQIKYYHRGVGVGLFVRRGMLVVISVLAGVVAWMITGGIEAGISVGIGVLVGAWIVAKASTGVSLRVAVVTCIVVYVCIVVVAWIVAGIGVGIVVSINIAIGIVVNSVPTVLGGAFGRGLSQNIRDGYLWLAEHYREGDDIYIFGFSRGAYTARSLVGLIRKCGIINRPNASKCQLGALTKEAYHIYREKQWDPDGREATVFKTTFSWSEETVKIKFLGVWDTVGALGIPLHYVPFGSDYYQWHDTELSRMVENAYQAQALDEHRLDYAPTMWSKVKTTKQGHEQWQKRGQTVEQRWFPGAHCDVGGGYKKGKLPQLSLQWMQQNSERCGLQFNPTVAVDPDTYLSPMHDSYKEFLLGIYARLPWVYPYYRPLGLGVSEKIDNLVPKRIQSSDGLNEDGEKYNPLNL
jgi:uncharacterized protein (DUF2235 family)